MADLTGKPIPDGYPNLVTIGATTDDNPTSGTLENGKGNTITRVSIGDVDSGGKLSVSGGTAAIGIVTEDWVDLTSGTRIESRLASSTGNTYGRIQVTDGGGLSASNLILQPDSGNVGIRKTTAAKELDVNGEIRASGGILFGSDTAAANTLDDYEEGTWTPVYEPQTGSFATMTMDVVGDATYTKIGRQVTVSCYIRTDDVDITGASGNLLIGGLPFTNGNTFYSITIGYLEDFTNAPDAGRIEGNVDKIQLMKSNATLLSQVGDLLTGTSANENRIALTATYFI